jgi:competence/damage-inducible protein CinA-like protein
MPTAEIITIGTELLLGETTDTNTRFIARALRNLGVDLFRTHSVGDNGARIAGCVQESLNRADIVITTGGLGPTVDDPTRQAIASATGRDLEFHPDLWEQISARIGRYGRTPTENQKRQAYIPQGAIALSNPVGTAPAFIVEIPSTGEETKVVISLPGVPREMETLLVDTVLPYLQNHFQMHEIIQVRTLHVSGMGEAVLDEQIGSLETLTNPTVGLTAHSGIVDIRIAAKADTVEKAHENIAALEEQIRSRLGNSIYGADDETLEEVILRALLRHGWTLACLESDLDNALISRFSRLGHPAYRGGQSHKVDADTMAESLESLQKEMSASVVLGVGVSDSGQGQDVFIMVITPRGRSERHLAYGGHPKNAHRWSVNMALDLLRFSLQEKA